MCGPAVSARPVGGACGGITLQPARKSGGEVRIYSKCRFQDSSANEWNCILSSPSVFCILGDSFLEIHLRGSQNWKEEQLAPTMLDSHYPLLYLFSGCCGVRASATNSRPLPEILGRLYCFIPHPEG